MLCGTAVVQTGLSVTTPIMSHAETPDENGVLITNPMQTVSFYDMFGESYDIKIPVRYEIWEENGDRVIQFGQARPVDNYKIDTSHLRKTNDSGTPIKYEIRPVMENPFEIDYSKSTTTHLAIKIRKSYLLTTA